MAFTASSVLPIDPSSSSETLPPGYWEREPESLEEWMKYTEVVTAPETLLFVESFLKDRMPKGVVLDARDCIFDVALPAHGEEVAKVYENVTQYCEANSGPNLPTCLSEMSPEGVTEDSRLREAANLLAPLLDPKAWKPEVNSEYYRAVKNGIVAPYISALNWWVRNHPMTEMRVLIVGAWSGADIQRVAIARKNLNGLIIDTYDHLSEPYWAEEFRQISMERFGGVVRGRHISCSPEVLGAKLEEMNAKYDLILCANSLHQYLRERRHFLAVVQAIAQALSVDGALIGLSPTLEGFRTMEGSLHVAMLAYSPASTTSSVTPYGTFTARVAGHTFCDPVLPPDFLISEFARLGIFLEAMTSSQASLRFVNPTNLKTGPEARGYLVLFGVRRPTNMIMDDIEAISSIPSVCERTNLGVMVRGLFAPRNVGRAITDDDSWFLMNCPYYVAEKTDGEGALLAICPNTEGDAVLTLRRGSASKPIFSHYRLAGYGNGPTIILDGEIVYDRGESEAWSFDIFGLARYEATEGFAWLTGMSLAHHWLQNQHLQNRLLNLGIKRWQRTSPRVVSELWGKVHEGIVLIYSCAPPPRLQGQLEVGCAKYVKKKTTYDILVKCVPGGFSPHVVDLPYNHNPSVVVEVEKMNDGRYLFVRYRPDKAGPNGPEVLAEKARSVHIGAVLRWLDYQCDTCPMEIDLERDHKFMALMRAGDSGIDDQFRAEIAATHFRTVLFHFGNGEKFESQWFYEMRAEYFKRVLMGTLDAVVLR